ncbi:conserved hypothetical protein [Ricinus communis]|uniref:Uncharacterized protein n=1 Tax=Ricinus communis TaxID=3988 RepID=B9TND8_RICCO|nr:conserved hypothetical protein [Ricinus communis]
MDRPVPVQILQHFGHAVFGQVGRRRAGDPTQFTQPARHQRRVIQAAGADDAIDAFLYQVHLAIIHPDHQINVRIPPPELRQARHHQCVGNPARHIHTQPALWSLGGTVQAGLGVIDQFKYFTAAIKIALTFRCQAEISGGAVQQACLQMFFKPLDHAGNRGCRQSQRVRCAHKTPAFDHAKKYLHCLYAIHASPW